MGDKGGKKDKDKSKKQKAIKQEQSKKGNKSAFTDFCETGLR